MLKTGDKLPEFISKNQDGETVHSKSFLGKKLIVFFYPGALTPTCTVEACNLRDFYKDLQAEGYQLVGISADTVQKQKRFHDKNHFPFDLIADESQEVVNLFGVWQLKKTFGKEYFGIVRTTFIFDQHGICTRRIDKVTSKTAAQQILQPTEE